jgi:hypothetical protein
MTAARRQGGQAEGPPLWRAGQRRSAILLTNRAFTTAFFGPEKKNGEVIPTRKWQ